MAVAAWLVWRRGGFAAAALPLTLFCLQLLFNVAWSVVFFGLRMPGTAFAEILVLWCLILATLLAFWRSVPLAGALMAPYLAWVTFAAGLNFAIWRMNI
jgi:tryptophan-rich sensory protein